MVMKFEILEKLFIFISAMVSTAVICYLAFTQVKGAPMPSAKIVTEAQLEFQKASEGYGACVCLSATGAMRVNDAKGNFVEVSADGKIVDTNCKSNAEEIPVLLSGLQCFQKYSQSK